VGEANTPHAVGSVEPAAAPGRDDVALVGTDEIEPGSVHVIVDDIHARVVLSGEIDADLSADLQQATEDVREAGLPVDVDVHHVTFMDSSGVAFLARLTSVTPGRVRLHNTPPTVKFLLEVTSIGTMLDIVEDEGEGGPGAPRATEPAEG
jgi:anti-anti-sigma factor